MAGEEPVTEGRFKEFERRIDDKNRSYDRRLGLLETNVQDMQKLLASVERISKSMEKMLIEQVRQGERLETQGERLKTQGERLEALEGRDGEKWRKAVGYALSAIISGAIALGFAYMQFKTT